MMVDLFALEEGDRFFREVKGRLALGQTLARRLMTPRGWHPSDTNYGTDLRDFFGVPFSNFELESAIRAEVLKEPVVRDVDISIYRDDPSFSVDCTVYTEEESFKFSMEVGEDSESEEAEIVAVVNNTKDYIGTVTETAALLVPKNVNRKGLTVQNTSPGSKVYYAFGRAPTTESLTIPASKEKDFLNLSTGALYLMTDAGREAVVKVQEYY